MCIVIDTDVFDTVFDKANVKHKDYEAVRDWIIEGKGKMVYGGSTYYKQIFQNSHKNRALANRLVDKIHKVNDSQVDEHEKRIKKLIADDNFDDRHISAIISASGCKLICSGDKRSTKFLKRAEVYKSYASVPKFYMSNKNTDLLTDINIADCCKPTKKLTKVQKEKLGGL